MSVDGALVSAGELQGALGEQLVGAAGSVHRRTEHGAIVPAVIAAMAALIAATRLRHVRPAGQAQETPEDASTRWPIPPWGIV